MYGLYIGGEMVSPKHIVTKILYAQNSPSVNDYIVGPVVDSMASIDYKFSPQARQCYKGSDWFERELMGRSLLIGTTFLRLCILKCKESVMLAFKLSGNRK